MSADLRRLIATLERRIEAIAVQVREQKCVDDGIYARVQVRNGRVIKGWPGARSLIWHMEGKITDLVTAHGDVMTAISAVYRLDCTCRLRPGGDGPRGLGMWAEIPPGTGESVTFDIKYSSDGTSWTTIFDVSTNPLPFIQDDDHTQFGVASFVVEPEAPESLHPGSPITIPEGYYIRLDLDSISSDDCAAARVTVSLTMDIVG